MPGLSRSLTHSALWEGVAIVVEALTVGFMGYLWASYARSPQAAAAMLP